MWTESRKPLIVIVDGNAAACRSIQRLVWSHGIHADAFTFASDFIAAIEGTPSFAPDCVVLNRQLCELNGFEVMKRVRQSRPNIPVICVTGTFDTGLLPVTTASEAAPSFEKPF